ncbi:single-stranded DNA-binding protein [compost metagenome]
MEKYSTEIVLQRFNGVLTMLGGKPQGEGERTGSSQPSGQRESYDLNDDIPF